MNTPIPEDKSALIEDAIFRGHKIEAIKLYRECTNLGLAESKNAVEKLEAQLRVTAPFKFTVSASGKGCAGVIIVSATLFFVFIIYLINR